MKILIGDTGLVGTTIKESMTFDLTFNSKNIDTINDYDIENSVVYLSCLPATKWMVNKNIKGDINNINKIIGLLSNIHFKQIILISTIDVYTDTPKLCNENDTIVVKNLSYGVNRYLFELLVKNMLTFDDLKIFRLPALFNKHIKKNVIFDLINGNNISDINTNSSYQWYNLDKLNDDINYYITTYPDESVFNLFTEPIDTQKIVNLFPHYVDSVVHLQNKVEYNYKTKFSPTGYIKNSNETLNEIKEFINETSNK